MQAVEAAVGKSCAETDGRCWPGENAVDGSRGCREDLVGYESGGLRGVEKRGKDAVQVEEGEEAGWGCLGTRKSYALHGRWAGEMRAGPVGSDWRMNIVTLMIRGEMDID